MPEVINGHNYYRYFCDGWFVTAQNSWFCNFRSRPQDAILNKAAYWSAVVSGQMSLSGILMVGLKAKGFVAAVEKVGYELHSGGNEMRQIQRAAQQRVTSTSGTLRAPSAG